jgi:6,7-dimethyl-8-ribityllumazine synthase
LAVFEGRFTKVSGFRIGTVVGRFNNLVTGKRLRACLESLSRHSIDVTPASEQLDVAWVPVSFETPLVALRLAASGRY